MAEFSSSSENQPSGSSARNRETLLALNRARNKTPGQDFDVFGVCLRLLEVSETCIGQLITTTDEPSPDFPTNLTLALMYCIINLIEQDSDRSTSRDLQRVLQKIDPTASLPTKISNLVAKVTKRAAKCSSEADVRKFLMTELEGKDSNFIGEECQRLGITVEVIDGKKSVTIEDVSDLIIAELEMHRGKNRESHETLAAWLKKILGWAKVNNVSIVDLKKKAVQLKDKRVKACRNKNEVTIETMRNTVFKIPQKPRLRQYAVGRSKPHSSKRIAATPRKDRVCTRCNTLHRTQKQLQSKGREVEKLYLQIRKLKQREKLMNLKEWELNKKDKYLNQKESNLVELDDLLSERQKRYNPVNVDKRESNYKTKVAKSKEEIKAQNEKLEQLRVKSKRKSDSIRNLQVKVASGKDVSALEREIVELKKKNKQLIDRVKELEFLETELNEIRLKKKPVLKKGKAFTDNVYECYMKLAACDVSSKNMSTIVASVLNIICKFDVTEADLPKNTKCKEFSGHANIAASLQVMESLKTAENATLHSDGTSRDGKKVVDYEITGSDGTTLTAGLIEVSSGDADTQLKGLNFIIQKLSSLESDSESDITQASKELIGKIKNTMGYQAATQKSFNSKLEAYRSTILPDITEGWEEMDDVTKAELLRMNHFFCNLHALIGCATYCDDGLKKLEETWRAGGTKLGVEGLKEFQDSSGNYNWKHSDSAVQRLIRTTCDALSPGGDQKSGAIGHFETYRKIKGIQHLEITPFRANRFNVLFEQGAGVWFHHKHIQEFFCDGYCLAGNKLLKAVYADNRCVPLLAGARSLGMLHKHITEPFWRLVEHADVHILDISPQVQNAYQKLEELSKDASPLINNSIDNFFSLPNGESIQPVVDHVFHSLYEGQTEEMDRLTKEALEVECASMMYLFQRRFSDHLEGKYSRNVSEAVREESKHTLKTNKRGENDFGYWAYIIQSKPSLNEMNMEGRVMFRLNRTDQFLQAKRQQNPAEYGRLMTKVRTQRLAFQKLYSQKKTETERTKARNMEERKVEHKRKESARQKREEDVQKKVAEMGQFKTADGVQNFINQCTTKKAKLEGLKAQIQNLKQKYDLTKLENNRKLLTVTGKTPEKMQEDLNSILTFVSASRLQENEAEINAVEIDAVPSTSLLHIKEHFWNAASNVNASRAQQPSSSGEPVHVPESTTREFEPDSDESFDDHDTDVPPPKRWRLDVNINVGDTIVAAWENGWYPGVVEEKVNDDQYKVSYLVHSGKSAHKFKWPELEDRQLTNVGAMLCHDIELIPDVSGRYVTIDEHSVIEINRLFNAYCNSLVA